MRILPKINPLKLQKNTQGKFYAVTACAHQKIKISQGTRSGRERARGMPGAAPSAAMVRRYRGPRRLPDGSCRFSPRLKILYTLAYIFQEKIMAV